MWVWMYFSHIKSELLVQMHFMNVYSISTYMVGKLLAPTYTCM